MKRVAKSFLQKNFLCSILNFEKPSVFQFFVITNVRSNIFFYSYFSCCIIVTKRSSVLIVNTDEIISRCDSKKIERFSNFNNLIIIYSKGYKSKPDLLVTQTQTKNFLLSLIVKL